ncbi:sugar phosphate isomerase/epimerase family protein [Priestia flexa]|uniref:sugar phosphate isomerase/epimerase family protein n=1 Tax=Priestia flexa TaxID=86664 RepID=UPI001CD20B3A|nr:sugar phosphate isomerase/epimerase [Priestia flexa]MCA1201732.1 sugar phosphate isomerase/epimerase [Priestia flexa]
MMKLGYQTNTWGGVVGHPAGVTSVKDSYYLANGSTEEALEDIKAAGGDPVEVMRKYIDRIKYVHLKDYQKGEFLPLGEGHQDFEDMIKVLEDAHYDGWITIELDSYQDPKVGAEISRKYLSKNETLTSI